MLAKTSVRVAVMHPNPVVAAGLEATFGREPEFQVRQILPRDDASPAAARRHAQELGAGFVVVADYQTALDFAARTDASNARFDAQPRLLVMASATRGWQIRNALESGIHGYVSHECQIRELVDAVRCVHRGERYLCAIASRCIAESLSQQHLTLRELDVLRLVQEGLDNKTISRRLDIALGTVKAHVRTLLEKLDAKSRTEAVAAAMKRGFIGEEAGVH